MKSDAQVLRELEQAVAGLLRMSESDYPFAIVRWEGSAEVSPDFLRAQAGEGAAATVTEVSVEQFFRAAASEPAWKDERERALAKRYQALVRLLQENLTDVKAYKVGEINMPVYIVGRSGTGNWLGVSTRVVET